MLLGYKTRKYEQRLTGQMKLYNDPSIAKYSFRRPYPYVTLYLVLPILDHTRLGISSQLLRRYKATQLNSADIEKRTLASYAM